MTLLGPNSEDQRKIHAEINQLVNQRFILTTVAITVFGLLIGFMVPRIPPTPRTDVGGFTFLLSATLSGLLFGLFLLAYLLKGTIRILTTYLKVSGASNWEKDWSEFKKQNPHVAYTKPHATVFLLLNAFGLSFPCLLAQIYDLNYAPLKGAVAQGIVGLLAALLILGMGFFRWWDKEKKLETQWKALKVE